MKKRIMTVVLALTMAVSLSACGSKSDVKAGNEVTLTLDEIQEKMAEAITNVKSVDAELDLALDLSMEASGQKASIKGDLDGEAQVSITNPGLHIKGNGSMSVEGLGDDQKQSGEMEAYIVTDSDKASVYLTTDGKDWITSSVTMEEFMEQMSELMDSMDTEGLGDLGDLSETDKISSELMDQFTPALNHKTVKAAGKECYEISTAIDKNTLAAMPGMEEYVAVLDMVGTYEIKAALYVDVATNLPVKVEMTADISADDDSTGVSVKLNECKITLELEYDTVETIEVPNKVKDSAVGQ